MSISGAGACLACASRQSQGSVQNVKEAPKRGKGSFGASNAEATFKAFGLDGKINLVDVEPSSAGANDRC